MSKAQKTVNATACGKRVKVEDSRHCHLKDKLFFSQSCMQHCSSKQSRNILFFGEKDKRHQEKDKKKSVPRSCSCGHVCLVESGRMTLALLVN